jgi:hypothetical protein
MARTAVRDVVIWVKHIHGEDVSRRVLDLQGGETLDLVVDGIRGAWRKMDDGRDGRPTMGIRPYRPHAGLLAGALCRPPWRRRHPRTAASRKRRAPLERVGPDRSRRSRALREARKAALDALARA